MKTHSDYPDHKTERQWALNGYLVRDNATGIKLWANQYCQDQYTYYSPDEVMQATKEQLSEYFKPERERKNALAKKRRKEHREYIERQRRLQHEREEQEMREEAIRPYLSRIAELHKIIRKLSSENSAPSPTEGKTIVVDTETTGLSASEDELLQVSIIDSEGTILFDSYFKPFAESWREAQSINGISPEMVKDSPRISDRLVELNEIFSQATKIIGYNIEFDLDFLQNNGVILPENVHIDDVMETFAIIYGEWNDYYGSYKWQKLTTAAAYYNYDWSSHAEQAHNSLADCFATLFVYNKTRE